MERPQFPLVTAACQLELILMAVGSCWLPTCYPTCDTHVMVELLLLHGAPIDTRMPGSGMQPLTQAIRSPKHGCVKVLVENGADIHHGTHGEYERNTYIMDALNVLSPYHCFSGKCFNC